MTNEQIIWAHRVKLRGDGILVNTGRMVPIVNDDGKKSYVAEPEQIHTFGEWKRRGYIIKHGEKAVSKFPIWKHTTKKAKNEGDSDTEQMFMKVAFFFKASQVGPTADDN